MSTEATSYLESIRSLIEEMRFTTEFYQGVRQESFASREEIELARTKMQYAKEHLLKKSFALKRALKYFEAHL